MIQTFPDKLLTGQSSREDIDEFLADREFPLVHDSLVTFVFRGEADSVELRHWIYGLPSSIPLSRLGHTDLWYRVMEFPFGSRIEYKFGVRRHGREEWLHDPLNPNIAFDPFGGNSVVRSSGCVDPEWTKPQENVSRGTLRRLVIDSEVFGDQRHVGVYVPAKFRDYRRYRLLIVHDGDDYLRYSRLNLVLDNLINALDIPPLIVALSNPVKRLNEYADDPRHADHIVNELLPELEKEFSLINQPSGRCLMGASFGAVASLSTAWRYPDTFGSLMVQSGSFAFTDIGDHTRSPAFDRVVEFMNRFRKEPGQPVKKMFVSSGVYESLIYENRSLVPFLQDQGINVKYVEAFDGHNWENWRDRLRDGLSWLFPGPLWVTYM